MWAWGQVPGLLLGPIWFKARGTLQRCAGRAADEKQTAGVGSWALGWKDDFHQASISGTSL